MRPLRVCEAMTRAPRVCHPDQTLHDCACMMAEHDVGALPVYENELLVGMITEMKAQKDLVREVAQETMKRHGVKLNYLVGTMIELPRAAVTAGQIAQEAEFFSFGTNDLTQTTFGFSRDDAAKFVGIYKDQKILDADPFETLDREGVGEMMRLAVGAGRKTREDLKLGICGEHGGDPRSIEFCHQLGLDYVSCSPYRVAIARLAAAHSALNSKPSGKTQPKGRNAAAARAKAPAGRSKKARAAKR